MGLTTRLITEVGTRASLRVFNYSSEIVCPVSKDRGCEASVKLADSAVREDWEPCGQPEQYPDDRWPTACAACGRAFQPNAHRQVHKDRLYDSPSGKPEPGDMYWTDQEHWEQDVTGWFDKAKQERPCKPTRCLARWTNCDGRHLHVVLPDGHVWNASGRASNCGLEDDQEHRCWVLTGEPPKITASKSGRTCQAGAGSIASASGWHGFLVNGVLA